MRRATWSLLVLLVFGCYRTHYENFSPNNPIRAPQSARPAHGTGWQHFFLYGLVPDERDIDARGICGGTENVAAIETRRTFAEGLVAAFAGYYINVYSPFDGAVFCGATPSAVPAPNPSPATTTP